MKKQPKIQAALLAAALLIGPIQAQEIQAFGDSSEPVASETSEIPDEIRALSHSEADTYEPALQEDIYRPSALKPEDSALDDFERDYNESFQEGSSTFVNEMAAGNMRVTEIQRLRSQAMVDSKFDKRPLSEAINDMAMASNINFIASNVPEDVKISGSFLMQPFTALEMACENFGLGLYDNNGIWFIQPRMDEKIVRKTYRLKHIHLGEASGGFGSTGSMGGMGMSGMYGAGGNFGMGSRYGAQSGSFNSLSGPAMQNRGAVAGQNGDTPNGYMNGTGMGGGTSSNAILSSIQEILGIDSSLLGDETSEKDKTIDTLPSSASSINGRMGANLNDFQNTKTYVAYDPNTNTVTIVASPTKHKWIEEFLDTVDKPNPNIQIDAFFLESDGGNQKRLGIDWGATFSNRPIGTQGTATIRQGDEVTYEGNENGLDIGLIDGDAADFAGKVGLGIIRTPDIAALINAFQETTDSQIASYPSLATANNQVATIKVQQKFPVEMEDLVVAGDEGNTTVVTRQTGTAEVGFDLEITPHVIDDGDGNMFIEVEIDLEMSSVAGDFTIGDVPPTVSTEYKGRVKLRSGETLSIGGLERLSLQNSNKKVPVLGDVPGLGRLFKHKGKDLQNSNIYLFMTLTILEDSDGTPYIVPAMKNDDKIKAASKHFDLWRDMRPKGPKR